MIEEERMELQDKMDRTHLGMFRRMLGVQELPCSLIDSYYDHKKLLDKLDGFLSAGDLASMAIRSGFNVKLMRFEGLTMSLTSETVTVDEAQTAVIEQDDEGDDDEEPEPEEESEPEEEAEPEVTEPSPQVESVTEEEPPEEEEEDEGKWVSEEEVTPKEPYKVGEYCSIFHDGEAKDLCKLLSAEKKRGVWVYKVFTDENEIVKNLRASDIRMND